MLKEMLMKGGRRSVAALVLLMVSTMTLWSQEMNEKFSMTTQMFLNELKEKQEQPATAPRKAPERQRPDGTFRPKARRLIASPDTVAGKVYISCFIHLKDVNDLNAVRALGVEVEETFDGLNFITARVPVNQLEPLANIDNVTRVKVAQQMRPLTDKAREVTNVDDLLTHSTDAIAAGIPDKYDGTGVVLGVIDLGIDFQHIAFKDKNGNSRIKRAYIYNGSSATEYTESTISSATTDDEYEDHGTHTASTAGGSSVVVSGSTVTVTDDHANATYGGMAPGADLYLAGIKDLYDTGLTNALKKMVTYADAQSKPLVVSNSWGSSWGSRDGTGEWADLVGTYFGDSHPNRVILFAASNNAGHKNDNEGGGYFVKKSSASSSSPLGTIIRTDGDGGDYYGGLIACAWNASNSTKLNCKIHVLNNSGTILNSWTVTTDGTSSFSGLSTYYSGSMTVYIAQENNKYRLALYSKDGIQTTSSGAYTLAIEVYPSSGSANINMWSGDWSFFTDNYTTSEHTWLDGTDDMCVSDEATIPDAISVGAYVSKKAWTDYSGSSHTSSVYTVGDIAYFSSYATADQSPTGLAYPWISAPGARLAAGVNHYHTTSVDGYSYFGSKYNKDLVVNNSNYPYAMMEGTSMATPVAAGIVALWLQAAKEVNQNLTVNDVKYIMEQTAINDSYTTTGTNASHFGKGKIDALAGIQYILASGGPTIRATPSSIDFGSDGYATLSYTQTLNVKGFNLEGGITATLSDANGVYSLSQTSITQSDAANGVDITITYAPQAAGTHNATITLTSSNATSVEVPLTATAKAAEPIIIAAPETLTFTAGLNESKNLTFDVLTEFLTGNVSVTLSDANNVFSIDKTSISKADSEEGATVTVTFQSATTGTYNGTVTLSSAGAENVVISLTGTAKDSSSNPNTTTFKLVSSTDYLEEGMRYIIACGSQSKAAGSLNSSYLNSVGITASSDVITIGDDVAVFMLEGNQTDGWTFKNENTNTYLYSSAAKSVGYSNTANTWTLSNGTAGVIMTYGEYGTMLYNVGSPRFTTYTSSPSASMIQANLYMEYSSGTTPVAKQDVTMSFSPTSATATMGESFTAPTLSTTPEGLTVTYSSSDTDVATVNTSTGAVTLVAAGTTIITATFAGNDFYKEGSASYTITVNEAVTLPEMPDDVEISSVTSTSITAAWEAMTNATSYDIDVALVSGTSSSSTSFIENFTGFTSVGSYSTTVASQTVNDRTWSYESVIMSPSGASNGTGSTGYAQLQATNGKLYLPTIDYPASITVTSRASSGSLSLQQKVNNTWNEINSWTLSSTGDTYSYTFTNAGAGIELRFVAGNKATYIHDITVTGASTSSNPTYTSLDGYPKSVGNVTSYTVTGLTPETQYAVRVRAVNSAGNSDWSETLTATTSSQSTNPTIAYYANADSKKGEALKTAMCGIIYDRTEKSYDYLWTAFQTTDVRSDGKIWDMYSNATNYVPGGSAQGANYSAEGDSYNREHSWPQSWFGGNTPMYYDLHHVFPTDGYVNNKRANYPFGETNGTGQGSYQSNGGFSKLGACTYPGYSGTVFEPADEYKGDFARTYFYMVTCYEEKLHDWYTNYSSTDVVNVIDGNTYPGLQTWQLNMLMKWAKDDPVSQKEINRNNAVYAIQNNRNPFIDYPGLQEYIWGSLTTSDFSYDNYQKPVNMSFSEATATATVGQAFTAPTLTLLPSGLSVTYSSSNTDVATVDPSTGEVTLVAAGTTIITATFAGNDSYNEGSATYTLTVSASSTPSGQTLLYEGLSNYSGNGDSSEALTTTSTYLDYKNWTSISKVYPSGNAQSNGGGLKFGSSSASGSIKSGSISLTGAGTLTFYLKQYGTDSGTMNVTVTGATADKTSFTPQSSWTLCIINLTNATGNVTIQLATSEKRAYVDEITLVSSSGTTPTNVAPVWSALPTPSTTLGGEDIELTISDYVTGTPTPTITLASTTANSADYDFDPNDGYFYFCPSATGTFTFTFTATNDEGSDEATLTVTVNPAPIIVPTLAVTEAEVTSTSAPVSWDACDGVSNYTLQLATDDEFTESSQGSNATLINESFENNSIPSTWTKSSSNISVVNGKSGDGDYCVAFKGNNAYLITPKLNNPTNVSFNYKRSNNTTAWSLDVSYSTSTSGPWINIGTVSSASTSWQTFTESLSNVGQVYIKITDTRNDGNHERYIDLVQITSVIEPVPGSLISSTTVNSTDYTFTGLTPETTYYARVKGNDDWSNVVSFTTNAVLSLANNADNSEAISTAATSGKKYDVTLADRTLWKDGDWNTLCLPFGLTADQIAASPIAGADIRALSDASFSNGTLTLNFTEDFTEEGATSAITAGTPYIMKWASNSSNITNPVFTGVTISNANNDVECDLGDNKSITFKGTYQPLSYTEDTPSILFLGTANNLYYPLNGASIGAQRAYFELSGLTAGTPASGSNQQQINAFVLNFEDGIATIVNTLNSDSSSLNAEWYDLNGRKLTGKPSTKGIYIHNGRKMVIR